MVSDTESISLINSDMSEKGMGKSRVTHVSEFTRLTGYGLQSRNEKWPQIMEEKYGGGWLQ